MPKKFFVTGGSATSDLSPLNAFDAALTEAGIGQCNLVSVSSILPSDAEQVSKMEITPGTITFVVMAHADGGEGKHIGAGVGLGWGSGEDGVKYGIVTEAHGFKVKKAIEEELRRKMIEMARIRKLRLHKTETRVECMEVPKKRYGAVVAAVVYLPWTPDEHSRI